MVTTKAVKSTPIRNSDDSKFNTLKITNNTVASDAKTTIPILILLRNERRTVNKCNAKNTYPANQKPSARETNLCSSMCKI
jgi:hypothetical protein